MKKQIEILKSEIEKKQRLVKVCKNPFYLELFRKAEEALKTLEDVNQKIKEYYVNK